MRVTGQMISKNSMANINRNKRNVNDKANRYMTGQAFQRPSEDPVGAVRALKYKTQLAKIDQYRDTNIPEALSWMNQTEDQITAIASLLKEINTYCNEAGNDYLENRDRDSILKTLESWKDQFYDLGNAQLAGRYLFTGFRTDTSLMFDEATNPLTDSEHTTYTIWENLKFSDITQKSYMIHGARYDMGANADNYAEDAPSVGKANRLQLSYTNIDGVNSVTLTDAEGHVVTYQVTTKSIADYDVGTSQDDMNPYYVEDDQIILIKETGELIFGKTVMEAAVTHTSISVKYDKTEFEKGDLRPEHYFACETNYYQNGDTDHPVETIKYTEPGVQEIEYEVSASQKLTVNVLAKDAISTRLRTKIDEIARAVNDCFDVRDKISEAEKLLASLPEGDAKRPALEKLIEELNTEKTMKDSFLTETFGSALTSTQKDLDMANVSVASIGARVTRGDLIKSRVDEERVTVQELLEGIAGVELEDAVTEYSEALLYYNASLQCASQMAENSLLDYLR